MKLSVRLYASVPITIALVVALGAGVYSNAAAQPASRKGTAEPASATSAVDVAPFEAGVPDNDTRPETLALVAPEPPETILAQPREGVDSSTLLTPLDVGPTGSSASAAYEYALMHGSPIPAKEAVSGPGSVSLALYSDSQYGQIEKDGSVTPTYQKTPVYFFSWPLDQDLQLGQRRPFSHSKYVAPGPDAKIAWNLIVTADKYTSIVGWQTIS